MTNQTELPIACSLTDAEFREREKAVLQKVMQMLLETRELPNGYAYRLKSDDDALKEIFEMMLLERKCCPFLQFNLTLEAGNGDAWLELTGAEGAKEFVAATFK